MLNEKFSKILKENNVNLKEEGVVVAFDDGIVALSLEDGNLDVNVHFTDRVIKVDGSIETVID
jgi:hypothetical protein